MNLRSRATCLGGLLGPLLFSGAACATTNFDTFIASRSQATQPLGSGDKFPVIQGGVTVYIQANQIATLTDTQTLSNKTISGANNSLTVRLGNDVSGTLPTSNGGLGITSFTSGGIPCFTSSSVIASSAALTANKPIIGGGAGVCPSVASTSGNTTEIATVSGSLTSGQGMVGDANGNLITSTNVPLINAAQTWTAQQVFGPLRGHSRTLAAGSTDTLDTSGATTSDCGGSVYYNVSSTMTVTLPATGAINCTVALFEEGSGRVVASPASGASMTSAHGYTGTFNAAGAVIGLTIDTNAGGSAAHYVLSGDGT